jgi:hypothetical protein
VGANVGFKVTPAHQEGSPAPPEPDALYIVDRALHASINTAISKRTRLRDSLEEPIAADDIFAGPRRHGSTELFRTYRPATHKIMW